MRYMNKSSKKKLRHGSVALIITVLAFVAVVILNIIIGMLASRYDWMYLDINSDTVYSISDDCREYVRKFVIPEIDRVNTSQASQQKIKIVFCDTPENINADEHLASIYDSVDELKEMFPEHIEIKHLNIWEQPSVAREYGATSTGDIICEFGTRHETVNFADFYLVDPNDNSTIIAYNGERTIAACLVKITEAAPPNCYFTVNHGEEIENVSLMRTLIDAGYTVNFLDLSTKEIPDDCELLVTYAPKRDMSANEGDRSEAQKVDEYMLNGGKYMVFISADTFAAGEHKNFEDLLERWGVDFMHKTSNDGIEQSCHIRDRYNSLTVDGYTVLSENASRGKASEVLSDKGYSNAFSNSTCIEFGRDFVSDKKGNYVKEQNGVKKTAFPLLVTHSTAEAWMGGITVARADEQPFVLMSMTVSERDDGKIGHLMACASTEFAAKDGMQSAVLGNSRVITEIVKYMGRESAPVELTFKSFGTSEIESLTTRTANIYTAILTVIPTLAVAIAGAVVLVRRRFL